MKSSRGRCSTYSTALLPVPSHNSLPAINLLCHLRSCPKANVLCRQCTHDWSHPNCCCRCGYRGICASHHPTASVPDLVSLSNFKLLRSRPIRICCLSLIRLPAFTDSILLQVCAAPFRTQCFPHLARLACSCLCLQPVSLLLLVLRPGQGTSGAAAAARESQCNVLV